MGDSETDGLRGRMEERRTSARSSRESCFRCWKSSATSVFEALTTFQPLAYHSQCPFKFSVTIVSSHYAFYHPPIFLECSGRYYRRDHIPLSSTTSIIPSKYGFSCSIFSILNLSSPSTTNASSPCRRPCIPDTFATHPNPKRSLFFATTGSLS